MVDSGRIPGQNLELKAAVEFSLGDEHQDFKKFLEVEC